jgi:hypothetical protein
MSWIATPVLGDRGIIQAGSWLRFRSIGWIVVLIFAIMLPFGLGGEAISHALPDQPVYQLMAKVVGAVIVLIVYTAFVRLGEGGGPRSFPFRRPHWEQWRASPSGWSCLAR